MCAIACQSANMLVLCLNVTVSVKKFTSVRLERSLEQLGRHINTVIIIAIGTLISSFAELLLLPILGLTALVAHKTAIKRLQSNSDDYLHGIYNFHTRQLLTHLHHTTESTTSTITNNNCS